MAADATELISSLVSYPDDTEWIAFEEGDVDPVRIARDISALANAAAYHGRDFAYALWGVSDHGHELQGTAFHVLATKTSGQTLAMWLKTVLSARTRYDFLETDLGDKHFVVLQVHAAHAQPVYYDRHAYIREGRSSTMLEPGSAEEQELWRRL